MPRFNVENVAFVEASNAKPLCSRCDEAITEHLQIEWLAINDDEVSPTIAYLCPRRETERLFTELLKRHTYARPT